MEDSISSGGSSVQENSVFNKKKPANESDFFIPHSYGDHKMILMVRDPWTLFTYWEIQQHKEDALRQEISRKGFTPAKNILRIYNVNSQDPSENPSIFKDYDLYSDSQDWYIHGDPGKDWMAEIGILCTTGEFFCLLKSNIVMTPRNNVCGLEADAKEEEWMSMDLMHRMFGQQGSSLELRELMERHLKKWLSSGGARSDSYGSSNMF